MKAWSFIIFWIGVNMAAMVLSNSGIIAVSQEFQSATTVSGWFNFTNILNITVGGIGAGLLGLIFRQYVHLAGALLIWAIGEAVFVLGGVYGGVNQILDAVFAGTGLSYIPTVITVFMTAIFFVSVFEIAAQRQIT